MGEDVDNCPNVSPLRGEWIEMMCPARTAARQSVSPLRGEWIEISMCMVYSPQKPSRLSEASGLKWLIDRSLSEIVRSRLSEASGLKCLHA